MKKPAVHRTKSDLARQYIQELIVSGQAHAGDRITTREISEAIAMSETPIREAIRSLAAEGWLTLHAHLGVVVASIRADELAEVYALRATLEALCIEFGGGLYSETQMRAIERNLAAAEAAVAAMDTAAYGRLNREFHVLLADTPATQWTLKLLQTIWAQTEAMHRGFEVVPHRLRRSLDEHRAIIQALHAHDLAGAARLVAEHEHTAGAALIAALQAG